MKSHEIDYTIHGDDMQVVSIKLDPNETVIAEAGTMNWMDSGIKFEEKNGWWKPTGDLKSMFFGGEGLFLAIIQGSGTVYLQSLPFSRLAQRIIQMAPRTGGKTRGEGSVLGTLGNLMDGDNRF